MTRWLVILPASLLLILSILTRAYDPPILLALRGAGFDTYQRLWPREITAPLPVRVVDIDEASLKELGQWPWPRSTLAQLTNELMALGAAAVAFDIVFPEPDRLSPRNFLRNAQTAEAIAAAGTRLDPSILPDNDETFAQAILGKPVSLSFASSGASQAVQAPLKAGFAQTGLDATNAPPRLFGITTNIPLLDNAATGIGSINIDLAREQGIARQIPFLWTDGTRNYPSLAVEALRVAQGADTLLINASAETANVIESLVVGDLEIPLSENGLFYVYYRPNVADLYLSAARVLSSKDSEALRPLVEGHVVFVGTSAVGLLDVRATALGEIVPGVSIHAQATEQILSGVFLSRPEWAVGAELIFVILTGAGLVILAAFFRPRLTLLSFVTLAALIVAIAVWSFKKQGLLIDTTFPLLALSLVSLASVALRLLVADKEGRKMRGAFAQYVAPAVLEEIERNPQSLKLGGEIRDVTVMFVDIENFTPLSEKLDPVNLVKVVNRLLDAGSKAILAERGTIDKYIGDAIMAFWNAPVPLENHQYHAAKAALGIRKAVAALNDNPELAQLLAERGAPRLAVRIGLASGPACVGNMGSSERFDYSVLGETVNTAARTESTCKAIGHDIAIAGELRGPTTGLASLYAGALPMKGKSKPEPLHILLRDEAHAGSDLFKSFRATYDALIQRLAQNGSGRKLPADLQALFEELASQHPELAEYFEKAVNRPKDFATAN